MPTRAKRRRASRTFTRSTYSPGAGGGPVPGRRFGIVAAVMPPVFWIGLGIAAAIFLIGVISGAKARSATVGTGAAIGALLGILLSFPLLAIGLATS